jgi:hypothetical protein
MNEHDQRQYRLMCDLLQRYEAAKTDLSSLIGGLEALLEALDDPCQEWNKQFRHEWGVLEIEYAVALDRGQTQLPPDSQARIDEAIKNMRRLLADRVTAETAVGDS